MFPASFRHIACLPACLPQMRLYRLYSFWRELDFNMELSQVTVTLTRNQLVGL